MRVLILSVTAGYGHNNTAYALSSELESRGASVIVEDFYMQVSRFAYEFVDKGYQFSVKHMRRPYKTAYASLERNEKARRFFAAMGSSRIFTKKYAKHLEELKPDVIIATHVFVAVVLNEIKIHEGISSAVLGINTDYCIQPFWEEIKNIDYIITGSELLNYIAIKKGINKELLLPLGLPIRSSFLKAYDKIEARVMLGLDKDARTVLIMGGSMGYGNMESAVSSLDELDMNLQIICICGKNERLYQHMKEIRTRSHLVVKSFVNNVEIYMDASDCIVTKPGGITVTEVLAKKLPMILLDPIPGHEERNAEFLVNNGAAMLVSKNFSVAEAVYCVFTNPARLQLMRSSLEAIAHPDAAEKICDFIENLMK